MAEIDFIRAARVDELSDRRGRLVRIGNDEIALYRVNGVVYALNNVCSHEHVSALHKGEVCGLQVSCPMHGWTYSLETGIATTGSGRVKIYPIKIQGSDVFVGVERIG